MEPVSSDPRLLAQRLHAGGVPEGDGRAAAVQIPPGYLYADRTGARPSHGVPFNTQNPNASCTRPVLVSKARLGSRL